MEKVDSEKKLYWMRKISLAKARDVLLIVNMKKGIRYTEISREGIGQNVFVRDDGRPLGHSHIYRYIRIPEKLGLLVQDDTKRYWANTSDRNVLALIESSRFLQPLDRGEKLALQRILVGNVDCRKAFLWMFMGKEDFCWADFVHNGLPVSISPTVVRNDKAFRTKRYEAHANGAQLILNSPIKRMAIEWGIQLWTRELSLTDEIYISETRHILYPVNLTKTLTFDDYLGVFMNKYAPSPKAEWSFFPIDKLTFELAPLLKVPVEEIQANFLMEAGRKIPKLVKFSSSSKGALVFQSSSDKTDAKVLKNFFKVNNAWMTHVLIHKNLWEVAQDGNIKD